MSTDLVVARALAAVAALMVLSHVLGVPYPILLGFGGLGIGSVPEFPTWSWTPIWSS